MKQGMTKAEIRNMMRVRRREVDSEAREEVSAEICEVLWERADVQAAVAAKRPFAEMVHGLSLDFLHERGLEPEEAMRQFFEFVGDDVLLVAHNATFDMRMVRQECRKFGLAFAPRGVETCDTLTLSRRLRPDLPSHKLSYLIGALDIDGVNSHDALDDALACAGVFFSFIKETMAKQNSRALPGDFFGIMCAHETGHDES